MKPFNVAVFGQGAVGTPVVHALHTPHEHLNTRADKQIHLSAIHRVDPVKAGQFFHDHPEYYRSPEEILGDENVDCVCELMGGIKKARSVIEQALRNGKHVVTANKAVLAEHWNEFDAIAKENDVQLRFEAAVAGGIPVLNALSGGSLGEEICEIRGIVNGTTNFILTQMEEQHMSYADALTLAQRKGYAEAIPSADVKGHDACQKLSLLIAHAFGKHIPPSAIPTEGIETVSLEDIQHAQSMGLKIKLISRAEHVDGKIIARVGPELVLEHSPLGQVPANLNAVEVRSNLNDIGNFYRGEGAGSNPTASSVLGDLIKTARDAERGYIPPFGCDVAQAENNPDTRNHAFYIRFVIEDAPGVVHQMSSVLERYNINLNSIVQLPYEYEAGETNTIPFFITVEDTDEETLRHALREITALPFNATKPTYIRFGRDDLWRKPKQHSQKTF